MIAENEKEFSFCHHLVMTSLYTRSMSTFKKGTRGGLTTPEDENAHQKVQKWAPEGANILDADENVKNYLTTLKM